MPCQRNRLPPLAPRRLAQRIRFATRFKPTTANTAILTTATQAVPATTLTRYGELQGAAQWLSTESGEYSLSPALPRP